MLSKKFLSKSLKTVSLLLATNLLLGVSLTLPSLAMEVDDQENPSTFHPFKIAGGTDIIVGKNPKSFAGGTDIIIRKNPKSFALVSRDYHDYVCKKAFIMMCIGKHKVDKCRYRLKAYGPKYATSYSPEYYKRTEQEELSLLLSLMDDKRQISKIDDYILPRPPIRVSDYYTDVVIDLLNNPEIPIKELELWHTFNTHVAGTDFFYEQQAGPFSKSTIFSLISTSIQEEIQHEVEGLEFTQERLKSIFETKISPLYPTERNKYIKSDVLKKMILLLDRIANNKTLQTLKVCCDGLDLIEDELLEALNKNSMVTSLSINPTQNSPFWWGENKLIDYLSTNKTLKNLTLQNLTVQWLTPELFEKLGKALEKNSIPTFISINAMMHFNSTEMKMTENYLRNKNSLKEITIKDFNLGDEGASEFMKTCNDLCKLKNIKLKIEGDKCNKVLKRNIILQLP